MYADDRALVEGRVFVDRRRAHDSATIVDAGATIDVYPPSQDSLPEVLILDRRRDLVAVSKPCGLSTIPDQRGTHASLQGEVARLLGERDPKRIHPTSRLDHDVSGVVLFALGKKARDKAHDAREHGRYLRHYVAIAAKAPTPRAGRATEPIGRSSHPRERRIGGRDAKSSVTEYASIVELTGPTLVAAEPVTGRTHQIRVHLAHHEAPLLGDRRYGGPTSIVTAKGSVVAIPRVALHAAWVRLAFDDTQPPWFIRCPIPRELEELWGLLGGDAQAWEAALRPLATFR